MPSISRLDVPSSTVPETAFPYRLRVLCEMLNPEVGLQFLPTRLIAQLRSFYDTTFHVQIHSNARKHEEFCISRSFLGVKVLKMSVMSALAARWPRAMSLSQARPLVGRLQIGAFQTRGPGFSLETANLF